jgi:3-aminobutyryl-CoA ammonia-lyase
MRAYSEVEFTAPVRAGDYLEVRARLEEVGRTSRRVRCTAHKVIALDSPDGSAASVLPEPQLVERALAIAVVAEDRQRQRAPSA